MKPEYEWDKHPSYGTVMFSRRSGCRSPLFGSSIKNHMSVVALIIREADRCHDLHADRIMGHKTIIEVELSAAQFAELLTTMNVGTGVPCTIRHVAGQGRIPDPPDIEIEIDRVQESFGGRIGILKDILKKGKETIQELGDKKVLGAKDKVQILEVVNKIIMEVTSNIPFIIDQFNQATERVVTAAKAEVDSFVTNVITQTGLTQLQTMRMDTKKLPKGKV